MPAPPIAVDSALAEQTEAEKRRRRKVLARAALVIAIGGAAWGAYAYVSSAPARAQSAYDDGMRLSAKGDLNGAEARFSRAIEISPQLAVAFLERGVTRRSLNNFDGAVSDFQQAMALNPNMGQAHTELGVIYRDRRDLTRAADEFTKAIAIEATSDAYYQRGEVFDSLGQHDKAVADYDAAIHEQPDSPHLYRARALAKDALGDHESAQADRYQAFRLEHR